MNGIYKASHWDPAQLDILIRRLRESGIAVEASWRRLRSECEPEKANQLYLSQGGKPFLIQRNRLGTVMPGRLPPAQADALLAVLHERDLTRPVNYTLGIMCALGYGLLYFLVVMPQLAAMGPLWLGCSIALLSGSIVALILAAMVAEGEMQVRGLWLLVLGAPGYILHAPGSLLLLPLPRATMVAYLTNRATRAARRIRHLATPSPG